MKTQIEATKQQRALIRKQQQQIRTQQAQIAQLMSRVRAIQVVLRTKSRTGCSSVHSLFTPVTGKCDMGRFRIRLGKESASWMRLSSKHALKF